MIFQARPSARPPKRPDRSSGESISNLATGKRYLALDRSGTGALVLDLHHACVARCLIVVKRDHKNVPKGRDSDLWSRKWSSKLRGGGGLNGPRFPGRWSGLVERGLMARLSVSLRILKLHGFYYARFRSL